MPRGRPKKKLDITTYDAHIDKAGEYVLTAFISNKTEKVEGSSIKECLEKLVTSNIVKGKCTLSVQKGELKSSMILSLMKVKRMYFNRIYREILEKQLNLRLT